MAPDKASLADAFAAAKEDLDDGPDDDATTEDTVTTEVTDDAPESPSDSIEGEEDDEALKEEDVPLDYFGKSLNGLPAAERAAIIDEWKQRDKLINQYQREAAAAKSAEKPVDEPQPELTDDVLLQAMNLDPSNDPYDEHTAKVALPLARMVLDLKAQVEGAVTAVTTSQTERTWTTELDRIEKQYGQLPVERVDLLEFAADNGIADPEVAYWRFMGPIRDAFGKDVEARLAKAKKSGKRSATTPRPRTSTKTAQTKLEAKDVKHAMQEAARLAADELGVTWEEATAAGKRRS